MVEREENSAKKLEVKINKAEKALKEEEDAIEKVNKVEKL